MQAIYQGISPERKLKFKEERDEFKTSMKWLMEVHVLRDSGREFQIKGAAEEKARLPQTDFTKGTCNKCWSEERKVRKGA